MAFVERMIDFAAQFDAPVIIGSMQGRADGRRDETDGAAATFGNALLQPRTSTPRTYDAAAALRAAQPIRDEPHQLARGRRGSCSRVSARPNVKLLADLYHMNIEEANLPAAHPRGRPHIGHVHFADSNRRAAGMGHTDFAPIVAALREVGYAGLSVGRGAAAAGLRCGREADDRIVPEVHRLTWLTSRS